MKSLFTVMKCSAGAKHNGVQRDRAQNSVHPLGRCITKQAVGGGLAAMMRQGCQRGAEPSSSTCPPRLVPWGVPTATQPSIRDTSMCERSIMCLWKLCWKLEACWGWMNLAMAFLCCGNILNI